MARNGKIARLPHALREEINTRLLDGESGSEILPWLNEQADVIQECEAHFEGIPISAQNLSEWRTGGYREWVNRRIKLESTKSLAAYSAKLANAGQGISSGARAVISGEILEALEEVAFATKQEGEAVDPIERLALAASAIERLSKGEREEKKMGQADEKLRLARLTIKQKDEQLSLSREKFELAAAEALFAKAQSQEVQAIMTSTDTKRVKVGMLRQLLFGDQGVRPGEGGTDE